MVLTSLSSRPGHRLRSLLGACLLAVASGASHAGVGLVWDMSNWHLSATPSQTLELHATVYNEASATEHLLGSRFVAAFGEGIEDAYDFVGTPIRLVFREQVREKRERKRRAKRR